MSSSPSKNVVMRSDNCLLGLAKELVVYILLKLPPADLMSCTRVCRALADIIEQTPAVQYCLQLGIAGMVDGPPNVAPVSKRFEQLRAFQAASLEGTLPMEITTYSQGYGWYMYHNDIDFFGHNHVLKLSRPASAFTGIPEKDVGHLYLEDHPPDQDLSIGNSAVDCEQDLVVMTQVDPVEAPRLYFLSISEEGAFHPLAAQPYVEGPAAWSWRPQECLEIRGDLVIWSITTGISQIFIYNWKTGKTVWEYGGIHDHVDKYHIRPYFLDATHIVVVHNTTLRIHEVSPTRQIRDSLVCTLELPALKAKKQPHDVRSCLQFPLSHLDEPEAPLFECDPSLTLLVLRFSACSTPSWQVHLSHPCKEFLALIPVSTMLAQAERVRAARRLDASGVASNQKRWNIPWKEWSPLGASLLELQGLDGPRSHLEPDVFAMGSRVLFMPHKRDRSEARDEAYIIDAHPLAIGPSDTGEPRIVVKKCLEDPEWFVDPVHNTLPCRVVRLVPSTDALDLDWGGLESFRLGKDCLHGVEIVRLPSSAPAETVCGFDPLVRDEMEEEDTDW